MRSERDVDCWDVVRLSDHGVVLMLHPFLGGVWGRHVEIRGVPGGESQSRDSASEERRGAGPEERAEENKRSKT
jgi:hypothetical protein